MVSVTIPKKMNEEIAALISAGYYDNRSEIIREAFRVFFATKPEVRLAVAIELYKEKKATISRAAEVAGISFEDMKTILADEGLIRRGARSARELRERSRKLRELVK